jgi:very-short-patch-repair endonuclease
VTPPHRTLTDLAAAYTPRALDDILDRALSRRVVTLPQLEQAIRPEPSERRPGVSVLRRQLALRHPGEAPAPSVLESRMGRLLRRLEAEEGMPLPQVEVAWSAGRYRLDFAWTALRLALEVDGYTWHATPEQMSRDLRRRNRLVAAGWVFLIYSWAQVTFDPGRVMAEIAAMYRQRAAMVQPA